MSISLRWLKVSVLVVLCGAFVGGAIQRGNSVRPYDQEEKQVRRNKYGAVIIDAQGNKINYTRGQLMAQKANWRGETVKSKFSSPMRPSDMAYAADVRWYYAAFGNEIGRSNIIVSESGGAPEIILSASFETWGDNEYWYALNYDETTGEYVHNFVSSYFPNGIQRMACADIIGDSEREIIVALEDGRIQLYDESSKEWLGEIATAANGLEGLAIADVDGDAQNELILCTYNHLYVYSGDGVLEWDILGVGGEDVVVGQMDADVTLEIAVTDGNVIDAATQSVQWTWPYGFGARMESGDIDFDNMDELIAAENWDFIWAYDVDQEVPKWSLSIDENIHAICLTDIDDDSTMELIVGESQWGAIECYDTINQALEWSIENPEYDITNIATGDVDGDGEKELLWGVENGYMYVVDWQTEKFEWENIKLRGEFIGPEAGDLDNDSRDELVFASSNRDYWYDYDGYPWYDRGSILIFNKNSPIPRAISNEIMFGKSNSGIHDFILYDVDKDGWSEIILATDIDGDGAIGIYGIDNSDVIYLKWVNSSRPDNAAFYSVEAGDIDNDGDLEIIAGAEEEDWERGTYIYVYDYKTGEEEWHSLHLGNGWDRVVSLELEDVDKDGIEEIIGMVESGSVYIFDGQSKQLEAVLLGDHTALKVIEWKNAPMILLGDRDGDISAYRYVSGSYTMIKQQNFLSERIDGISLGPEGTNQFFLGSKGTLSVVTPSGTVWQSSSYGEIFGKHTEVMSGGQWFVSAGSYAILAFKYNF